MLQWSVHFCNPLRHLFYLQSSQPIKMHTISSMPTAGELMKRDTAASGVRLVVKLHISHENTVSPCSFNIYLLYTLYGLDTLYSVLN